MNGYLKYAETQGEFIIVMNVVMMAAFDRQDDEALITETIQECLKAYRSLPERVYRRNTVEFLNRAERP